ncbi:hypothetical protein [Chryseobacterium sp. Mn2064]|uniref:hypothetical protein n=1 Tax=Chryseobacterium sp. Mn2064 TaxID=3395263 RepID=UPI003BD87473
MKKTYLFISCMLISGYANSQVGINTQNPEKTLDVNGEVKIRTINEVNTMTSSDKILVVNDTQGVVNKIALNTLKTVNTTMYAAEKNSALKLLNLGLSFGTWKTIDFINSDKTIGSSSLLSDTDHSYTVPSTGTYAVGFYFRYGTGIQLSILNLSSSVGILKKTTSGYSILDSREFLGVNLSVGNINICESSINSIYNLQAGDKLYFGVDNGGVTLSLLTSSRSYFYIYKISD